MLGDNWRGCAPSEGGETITLQPGVIGAMANRRLVPFRRKIGPDPASIDSAMIGGIAANNASGMCCGTAQNSYQTLAGLRVVLADGTVLDTRDAASRAAFVARKPALVHGLDALCDAVRTNESLAARIRHKFKMKNTTGYSLNALVDFTDPIDILAHLMIGSEGTLGFMSEISYHTVPDYTDKASALILFDELEAACRAVTILKGEPVAAVELADRAALRSVEGKPGLPDSLHKVGPHGAALLVETRAPDPTALAAQILAIEAALAGVHTYEPVRFSTDAQECARYWNVRKGMFPSVGAMRKVGTTVIIEDVAFPVPRLAEATLDLQQLLAAHGYPDAIIFGHALAGNLHFVFTQDFNTEVEVERYRGFMDALCRMVVDKYDGSLKAEHGTGRNVAPFVELEWGAEAYALMRGIKRLFDPQGLLNPGVILNGDPDAHVKNLKPLPACDPIVDKCIECGFCEPKCPSRGLTLSPRQRIVGWREIARRERSGEDAAATATLLELYDYHGIDTCAACGLCATACPVGIETGLLIKSLRGRRAGSARATRSRRGCWSLCRDDGRRSRGTCRRRLAARAGRHPGDAALARRDAPSIRRPDTQVVARIAPRRQLQAPVAAARDGHRARCVLSELCRPHHGSATRRRHGTRSRRGRAVVPQSRIRRRLSEGARGALLRPAVREQGPGGGSRPEVGGTGARVARGQRQRAMADRFRHQSMHVSDATLLRRTSRGPGQHRVHPRYGAATSRDRAWARAGRRASGLQRAQDGHGG